MDQASIYLSYKKLTEIEDSSKKSTKDSKKRLEREDRLSKDNTPKAIPPVPELLSPVMKVLNDEIKPYEELEYNTPRRSFR